MQLECTYEGDWKAADGWSDLADRAVAALCELVPELNNPRLSASLLFTTDTEILALNREWRGKDKATNVLSFPMLTAKELAMSAAEGPPILLGDVALAYETCAREARDKSIALADHAFHLIVHGLLHLAGYDHETSAQEAEAMEELETKTLARCGIADPYAVDHKPGG